MPSVTILTHRANLEVDVIFPAPGINDWDLHTDLHVNVLRQVDGARTKDGRIDGIVAIRKRDDDEVVQNLANVYRNRDWDVTIAQGK